MKNEIIIVLIINNHFVRWESMPIKSTIYDFSKMIRRKYVIPESIMFEIHDEPISAKSKSKIISFCKNDDTNIVIRLFTRGSLEKLVEIEIIE